MLGGGELLKRHCQGQDSGGKDFWFLVKGRNQGDEPSSSRFVPVEALSAGQGENC